MSQRRGSPRERSDRVPSGRGGVWAPLWILSALTVLAWCGTPSQRRPSWSDLRFDGWPSEWKLSFLESSEPELELPEPQLWLDPASLQWTLAETCDPRWSEELQTLVEEFAPFPLDDDESFGSLIASLEALSFVAEVSSVVPADGLGRELELVLREPVACIPADGSFYAVDAEGVLLSGSWEKPLYCGGLPLPVIGPVSDAFGLFRSARPGDWLVEPDHLEALDVALSMAEHLAPEARLALGRMLIDASQAPRTSVENPGIELRLSGRRLVVFGRAVHSGQPGSLSAESKWAALESCLQGERAEALQGWELLDLRWDFPEVDLEPTLLAQLDPVSPPGGLPSSPGSWASALDPTRRIGSSPPSGPSASRVR